MSDGELGRAVMAYIRGVGRPYLHLSIEAVVEIVRFDVAERLASTLDLSRPGVRLVAVGGALDALRADPQQNC